MTDRELLELAAKAAWYEPEEYIDSKNMLVIFNPESGTSNNLWGPLTDDGDALRLAVKLKINIDTALSYFGAPDDNCNCSIHKTEPYAATRRAIVIAAAEIGKVK